MKIHKIFALLFIATMLFTSCSDDDEPETTNTIVDIAVGDAQFSTLVSALQRTNLVTTLQGAGPFTVFAPTNTAFTNLGVDLATISDADLTDILLYHVFGGQINAADIQVGQTYISTASTAGPGNTNLSMLVENTGGAVQLNGSINVTTADVSADNGVIHIIDAVATPLDIVGHAAANSNFSSLVGALSAAPGDLVSVLQGDGPFTVFAPVNTAFDAIASTVAGLTGDQLASVLTYHVVSGNVLSPTLADNQVVSTVAGQDLTVNLSSGTQLTDATGENSNIVAVDVQATNGVVHVLDRVLIPAL